jgi:methylthioribose-1-phosphate isomerase
MSLNMSSLNSKFTELRSVEWLDGSIRIIDQTKLPSKLEYVQLRDAQEVAEALKSMKVRGAPLIGVVAALGLALVASNSKASERDALLREIEEAASVIRKTRPTAVNLSWAINQALDRARASTSMNEMRKNVIGLAIHMLEEDVSTNIKMGKVGAELIEDGDTVLVHCNTGTLATAGYGTAHGVLRAAWGMGKRFKVIATETRPLLQGARLTAFELKHDGIPVTLITDGMVGHVLSRRLARKVFVGADRIAANGDVCNKIGTSTIAFVAKAFGVPFYSVAPTSSIDISTPSGEMVVIEERDAREVLEIEGKRIAPEGVPVLNPAFDVTPAAYVTAIVTERGILYPPLEQSIKRILA